MNTQPSHNSRFEKTSRREKFIFPYDSEALPGTNTLPGGPSLTLPEPIRARDMVGESSLWAGTVR